MRNLLIMAMAIVGLGFVAESKASAQGYTVYIMNINNQKAGWMRSGTAGEIYTTKQACINAITRRVADNKRNRTDWEAFAVVRTTCRPGWGALTLANVPCGWNGQVRYWPGDKNFRPITVWNAPVPKLQPLLPLYLRDETAVA